MIFAPISLSASNFFDKSLAAPVATVYVIVNGSAYSFNIWNSHSQTL